MANHSIGLAAKRNRRGVDTEMIYLVRQGDQLPAKGTVTVYADEEIKAGSDDSLNFKLYEGEIDEPVMDNRFIGNIKIFGYEFDFGNDENLNYYVADDGKLNSNETAEKLSREGKNLIDRIRQLGKAIDDGDDYEKLQRAGEIVSTAITSSCTENDREEIKHLEQNLNDVKTTLNQIRKNNLDAIHRHELDSAVKFSKMLSKNVHASGY